jgi:hypothetical protein
VLREPTWRDQMARAGHAALARLWSERTVVPRYLEIVKAAAVERGRHHIVDTLS